MVSDAPCSSFLVTAFVGPLILITWLLCFILLVLVGLVTSPLLCWDRFLWHHIQSGLFRFLNAIIVVGLNPFWSARVLRIGEADGTNPDGLGCIYFVNHRSNSDPWFTAWLQLRSCFEARYVYKASLNKVPFAGCCCMLADDLAAKFGDKDAIKAMLNHAKDVLSEGYNVVVYPEGTRSPSGILQNFKPTFFEICAELGCAAVPIALLGTERAWPAQGARMGCATVTTVLGKAIAPGPGGGAQLSIDVAKAFRQMAKEAYDEGLCDEDDPLITDQPYPWWEVPEQFAELQEYEQLSLLREGKMHERGKNLV
jgi:1-acyl-sn-glycerol-3-phosphate acyltransferase